ncbi:beta-ketoacyl synthase N-terminal-like domain-containing protein [Streptomyces sp. SP17BM10]|uniref:beta-ketoacyl-[acyl-carrier-protein] synthase family protein n=1 Tax=Streptomyces sp. SP17BM10 TaxID=3002530 RepID=UPI002E76E678|nr:beta-ketoacyl synthase N-terminal-like domain-containing protein [Streptomyces sp. SP17BM10]MEE1784234.1 beta-ketoacyl synthase N-terminal-like domain-containing protein [Streptomyces sp. SP17BM10]
MTIRPIIGMGAVAATGSGVGELFENLCAGVSGRAELRGFDRTRFRAQHAYEVDDRPAPGEDVPGRASRLLHEAIAQAAADAGLGEDLSGIPILVGTGLRELRSLELWWADGSPFADSGLHFGTGLRERFNADVTHTFSNACSASLYALALAGDLLDQEGPDAPDTVIVAGVDVLTESMYGLLERVHATPPDRVRPFDRNRTGVLMGDGAAAIVLRRTEEGAPQVHARLRGVAVNCDAFHVTAPSPEGIAEAMHAAHRLAGVKPADLDLVMVHGTGTLLNDEAEATALAAVLGDDASGPLMTAVKSMTGHTSGASGLINLIVGVRALNEGRVPPTVGLEDPVDEAAKFSFVTGEAATDRTLRLAQLNAFGFGGINAVAIVEGTQ